MLDFTPVRNKEISLAELVADLTLADLKNLTNEMIDTQLGLLAACQDADVTFVPIDPDAHDPYAESDQDLEIAWTLGHVIVHATASSEESAFLAAELARGVPYREGRSRYEVPWEDLQTIAACRARLEESRRMRLAALEIWPDEPHWQNSYQTRSGLDVTPVIRFVFGLAHDDAHLEQIQEIVRQAQSARTE